MNFRNTPRILGKALALAALLLGAGAFTGCGGFFQPITSTTTTNSGTGYDLVYLAKNNNNTFVGYSISGGTLTAVTGSPFSLTSPPLSMAITPSNTYLYVANTVGVYGYTIAAGGGLTALNSGSAVANTPSVLAYGPVSMDVSPDGTWLVVLTANVGGSANIIVYQIATSTGLLTFQNTATISLAASASAVMHTIKISPNQNLVAASLGSAGTLVVPFTNLQTLSSLIVVPTLTPPVATDSDNSVLFSSASNEIFVTRGGSAANIWYYPVNSTTGAVTTGCSTCYVTTGTNSTSNPAALSFNFGPPSTSSTITQSYIYAANSGDNTIIGYPINISSSSVTTLGAPLYGGPYSTLGYTPYALAYDNSGTYVLAFNQTGPPDLLEYTVDTTSTTVGRLYVTASVSTGLTAASGSVPGVTMVTTH